ncbi:Uma2 family endonuclease [Paludisphaera sp.]|uniref:Uma2 family endonuclease n=1 Tax=Paludisphaera sp. TaxID=2017432 RepID=UPI00301D7235
MATVTTRRGKAEADRPAGRDAAVSLLVPPDAGLRVDAEGFERLCAANRDLRLELKADGTLVVMSPASSDSGRRNALLTTRLTIWNEAARLGYSFDSSSGFTFPDGSVMAPDASWILAERWRGLSPEDGRGFARIVPDFVVELRSPSDTIAESREKMRVYLANGVRLGWLIDPMTRTVEIHRPGREVETLTRPGAIPGEDVLPGFTLDLSGILTDDA